MINTAGPLTLRTAAENQFLLEASFCATSDQILSSLSDGINEWLNYTINDKIIQFAGMLQNNRRDLRLGGIIGIYRLLRSDQN